MINTSQPLTATSQWLSRHNPLSLSLLALWAIASLTAATTAYFRIPFTLVVLMAISGSAALVWLLQNRSETNEVPDNSQDEASEPLETVMFSEYSVDDVDVNSENYGTSEDCISYFNGFIENSTDYALTSVDN
jgi:hypothetical protein